LLNVVEQLLVLFEREEGFNRRTVVLLVKGSEVEVQHERREVHNLEVQDHVPEDDTMLLVEALTHDDLVPLLNHYVEELLVESNRRQ